MGDFTEEDSTKAIAPPSPSSRPISRPSRSPPRNTDSKAADQSWSAVSMTVP
jgi:hypothetical protein